MFEFVWHKHGLYDDCSHIYSATYGDTGAFLWHSVLYSSQIFKFIPRDMIQYYIYTILYYDTISKVNFIILYYCFLILSVWKLQFEIKYWKIRGMFLKIFIYKWEFNAIYFFKMISCIWPSRLIVTKYIRLVQFLTTFLIFLALFH